MVLLGSGQLIRIGQITIRMILFSICLIISSLFIIKYRPIFTKIDINLICAYTLYIIYGFSIGLINGANFSNLLEDVKPFSFFFIFPFLLIFSNNYRAIRFINESLCYLPLLMAIVYIGYLVIIKMLGIITFGETYDMTENQSDFMFRGKTGEFFYKGFIYLTIGLIFWISKKKLIPILIISIAILYTLTRGFYIISFIGIFIYYYSKSSQHKKIAIIFTALLSLFVIFIIYKNLQLEDRDSGDQIRIITFQQVANSITLISSFVGHGFGIGVDIRPIHMENSYLEIFHKTGIIGLIFWFYVLYTIIQYYTKVPHKSTPLIYFTGVLMIYIQSLFNPYISNPIGIGYLLISYCVIRFYSNVRNNSNLLCSF